MLRFLADENFPGPVLAGPYRRQPDLDIVRAIDVGLGNTDDRIILDWAAKEGRVIVTRDTATMVGQRLRSRSPGATYARRVCVARSSHPSRQD